MDQEIKRDYYLTKAKEADEKAQQAAAPSARETWARIADNYRDLARREGQRFPKR